MTKSSKRLNRSKNRKKSKESKLSNPFRKESKLSKSNMNKLVRIKLKSTEKTKRIFSSLSKIKARAYEVGATFDGIRITL